MVKFDFGHITHP